MPMPPNAFLSPKENLIFRIIHIENLSWIIENGLHCSNSTVQDPDFVNIGNAEIIDRRRRRPVNIAPFGTLSDYIPFYFTPWSIMHYNIATGHGITQVPSEKIIILVTRLTILRKFEIKFIFTDRHALLTPAKFFNEIADLDGFLDWKVLRNRDFKRDNDDPGKLERYQAEALIYKYLPFNAISGIVCVSPETKAKALSMVEKCNFNGKVIHKTDWFFN
jgi:hypothetical protein